MLNIKEIALKVADSLRNKIDGISHMQSNQGLVAFAEALIAELAKEEQRVAEYNELIYAVQTKHPDETRHQTALRYIRNAENRQSYTAANGTSS